MNVNENDISFSGDAVTYKGQLLNGSIVDYYSNGQMQCEIPYRNGFQEGVCREYHENGQIAAEWTADRGVLNGLSQEWFEDGRIKKVVEGYNQVIWRSCEWGKNGVIINKHVIGPESDMPIRMSKYREEFRKWLGENSFES